MQNSFDYFVVKMLLKMLNAIMNGNMTMAVTDYYIHSQRITNGTAIAIMPVNTTTIMKRL